MCEHVSTAVCTRGRTGANKGGRLCQKLGIDEHELVMFFQEADLSDKQGDRESQPEVLPVAAGIMRQSVDILAR